MLHLNKREKGRISFPLIKGRQGPRRFRESVARVFIDSYRSRLQGLARVMRLEGQENRGRIATSRPPDQRPAHREAIR
jgi:hypothetical protein